MPGAISLGIDKLERHRYRPQSPSLCDTRVLAPLAPARGNPTLGKNEWQSRLPGARRHLTIRVALVPAARFRSERERILTKLPQRAATTWLEEIADLPVKQHLNERLIAFGSQVMRGGCGAILGKRYSSIRRVQPSRGRGAPRHGRPGVTAGAIQAMFQGQSMYR
jgi:hypothetical protein